MATENGTSLAPEDAFSVLGNETRMTILRELGDADDPLPFSALRDRSGIRDSGQFNYHLDKLTGHFVRQTENGYELRQPGRRVIEAVLSGAVTQDRALDATPVEATCQFCGSGIELSYRAERVTLRCPDCPGLYGHFSPDALQEEYGYLGSMQLPQAGVRGRTANEVLRAASTWSHLELMAWASGVCPRCSATVSQTVTICEDHNAGDTVCGACGNRYAANVEGACTNCIRTYEGLFAVHLFNHPALIAFVAEHGLNPIAHGVDWGWIWDEEILSQDPFQAVYTHTIDGDSIALTVNDDLDVVDVNRIPSTTDDT